MTSARYGAYRGHLDARGGPPGTIKEGFDKLKLIDFDTRSTRPSRRFAGAADISSALRAKSRHRAKKLKIGAAS